MGAKKNIFRPVSPKRIFEDISDQIKGLIYSGALKPDDRLPSERELAERFNTGRMSVREALHILEELGFITIKQGVEGGTFVKELDTTGMTQSISGLINIGNLTIQEIRDARISIESTILESSIKHFTKKQLAALASNINDCERFYKDRKKVEYPQYAGEQLGKFHILIAETSKNRLFKYFVRALLDLFVHGTIRYRPDAAEYSRHLRYHKAMYEAIKAKDLKRAKKALESHLNAIIAYVQRTTGDADKGRRT